MYNQRKGLQPDYSQMSLRQELEARFAELERQEAAKKLPVLLSKEDRIRAIKSGQPIQINIKNNPNAVGKWPAYYIPEWGEYYINKYKDIVDKYAQKYEINPDIPQAVMYTEAATGHKYGLNELGDFMQISGSQMPMNIQGETWGDFNGTYYDTSDPEQNIELGVRLLKSLQQAVPDRDIAKIGTLWNNTGATEISDFGARIKNCYDNYFWDTSKMTPNLEY